MKITASQLRKKPKALINALKKHQTVEITYHGVVLGLFHPMHDSKTLSEESIEAMDQFFGMHRKDSQMSVDEELREIRKPRKNIEKLKKLRGKLKWDGDLEEMRASTLLK